jgi:CheY-like chemotaxis protein
MAQTPSTPPPSTDDSAAPLSGTVLYIEDEPVCVELVRGMLETLPGICLLHAATGTEGVALVRSHRPDMVLLDMHLPDIGGVEVVRQLSRDMAERGMRVTILTGDQLNMDIIKAMSLGAYEYWVKPLHHRVLQDGLRRALTGKRPNPSRTLAVYR